MKRLAVLLLLTGCSASSKGGLPAFQAGVAVVEITPAKNVPLGGYGSRLGKPMTGFHDPIYAKALWLETPTYRVCLVTTDLIGSTRELRDRIRPEDASVILAASHTHSGPGALGKGFWQAAMGKYDPEFHDEILAKLKRAVEQARAARQPARMAFVRGEAPEWCKNRRSKGGPVDPELNVLLVTDAASQPLAIVTNYAAHGTIVPEEGFLVSGDWPGAFQRALERRSPAVSLFTNGAEGDIAPRPPSEKSDFEQCESLGAAMADRVWSLARSIEKTTNQVTIKYVEREVDLPDSTLPLPVAPERSVLGMLDINGTRMFCFPGEPCAELGLELKRRFPGSWILGLANDHLGYFLTEAEYKKGGYERTVSFYGAGMGPWLVEQFSTLGERDHAEDRASQPKGGSGKDDHGR